MTQAVLLLVVLAMAEALRRTTRERKTMRVGERAHALHHGGLRIGD